MPRLETDPQLEFEADKSGMIHVRKSQSETHVLPGYGTTDFGVSPFESKKLLTAGRLLMSAGILSAGFFSWKYRERIADQIQVLSDYALLLRESSKS